MDRLEGSVDKFGGVTVELNDFAGGEEQFSSALKEALAGWAGAGRKLVWLKLSRALVGLVPAALEEGFDFHHAEPTHVMLTKPLLPGAIFPGYATHYAGAGGVVINDSGELLVVVEKHDMRERPEAYKLPGGLVEAGERIAEAVEREVREETGVVARFGRLVGFGHVTRWFLRKPSLYFVCTLTPLTSEIARDETEIGDARWMPVEEFLALDSVLPFNKRIVGQALRSGDDALAASDVDGRPDLEMFFPELGE